MEKRPPPATEQREAPSTFYEETLREDGTKVEERLEINEDGIPVTTELVIVTREGKRQDLLDLVGPRTTAVCAQQLLETIKESCVQEHSGITAVSTVPSFLELCLREHNFYNTIYPSTTEGGEPRTFLLYPGLSKSGDVLAFLHEEGHSRKGDQPEFIKRTQSLRKAVTEEGIRAFNEIETYRLRLQGSPREGEVALPIWILVENGLINPRVAGYLEQMRCEKLHLPKDLARKVYQHIAEDERDSTAFALNTIRNLRNEGTDLEPDLDLDRLREEIYGALRSHEASSPFEEELFTKGKGVGFEKYARIFWKPAFDTQRDRLNFTRLLAGKKPLSEEEFCRVKGKNLFERRKRESRRRAGKTAG